MMDNEYKQHHGANNRPANNIVEENEEEEIIRPSIPSIIPLENHNDIRNTSSLPNEGDDSSGCSISSLISEVTLMTFSEEKATMLKSEFLSRMQQESHTRPLSRDEKMALLTEIQADQDKKFKLEMQRQETKRSIKREGERTRHEFFDRLNALRVDIGREDVQLQHQQMEDDQSNISEIKPFPYRSGGGGVVSSDNGTEHEEKQKGQQISCRRASMRRRYERRMSGLSSSGEKIGLTIYDPSSQLLTAAHIYIWGPLLRTSLLLQTSQRSDVTPADHYFQIPTAIMVITCPQQPRR